VAAPAYVPRLPDIKRTAGPAPVPVAATKHSAAISGRLVFAFAIALALLGAAVALLPARVLRGPVLSFVEPRRDAVFIGWLALAAIIEIGYAIGAW